MPAPMMMVVVVVEEMVVMVVVVEVMVMMVVVMPLGELHALVGGRDFRLGSGVQRRQNRQRVRRRLQQIGH